MYQPEHFEAGPDDINKRLDLLLSEKFPEKTRSQYTRLIKNGTIRVNGQPVKPGYLLKAGDVVVIQFIEETTGLAPMPLELNICYEDESLLVIDKPAGLTVHPGRGTKNDTLVNALIHYASGLSRLGGMDRPGIVHRLDKNTAGLMVVAKNDQVHLKLRQQFDSRTIHRTYLALVWGIPDKKRGTVHAHIQRSRRNPKTMTTSSSGKEAITHYIVLEEFNFVSLLEIRLDTGRTHQIRVHMKHMNHPVVGDPEYNGRDTQLNRLPSNFKRRGSHLLDLLPYQFLHAGKLEFIHPLTHKNMVFQIPLPPVLQTVLDKLPQLFLVP